MKKKANGVFRARVTARGYEQIDGEHFDSTEIAAPVVAEMTIHVLWILIMMALLHAQLMDVIGAFLLGQFNPKHKMYMRVPRGFEKFYPPGVVLLLERTLYGTRQAAMAFWKKALEVMKHLGMKRSNADPCLYYKWTNSGLLFWASWVDDFLGAGQKQDVIDSKEGIKSQMDCEDAGELVEYIGCKLDKDVAERTMKITQPVLLQSLIDEFELPARDYTIPAPAGEVLNPDDPGDEMLDPGGHSKYRSGVGKLLHLAKWSRPDILNAVRELSKFTANPRQSHMRAMLRCMKYVVLTPDRGLVLKPNRKWDGKDKNFEFEISGMADAEYAKDTESRRSVSGYCTFLEGAVVSAKSRQQRCVTLSTTEAEMMAMTDCVQDMLYIRDVIQSLVFGCF
jgi:Reverse transcriptase (RNA-dependent DNA polymerase)